MEFLLIYVYKIYIIKGRGPIPILSLMSYRHTYVGHLHCFFLQEHGSNISRARSRITQVTTLKSYGSQSLSLQNH